MKKYITLAALVASTLVFAQSSVIDQRKALFKEMGAASRPIGAMLKGEQPFDLKLVKAALENYSKNSKALPALFPAGSGTGDTKALPKIWEEQAKYNALFAELDTNATKALASITDEASFKAQMGGILKSCGTCHETYRGK